MNPASSPPVFAGELDVIRDLSSPLRDAADLDPLLERVGESRFVLLGEASHGTAEYYSWRAEITKRLIIERGFSFVAVEGDWPECYTVNRWVKQRSEPDLPARRLLAGFQRWPTWMWANEEVAGFIDWLRRWNGSCGNRVGFYGLDVYSLWESLSTVLRYLTDNHPEALQSARNALRCFEPFGEDPKRYAKAAGMVPSSCEEEVIDLLKELRSRPLYFEGDPEAAFDARQNAEVLAGAERYYRAMLDASAESWNIRDGHMADTLDRLMEHHGPAAKAVVWEHNTHVGDARATDMAGQGMVNVGQLVRERHAADGVMLVGFGGHRGRVIAADFWGAPMRRMAVPEAPEGTHEGLLHRALDSAPGLLVFPDERDIPWLNARRGHRAIGVVYHAANERYGNWVPTIMGRRYDAFVYLDETGALHPLHAESAQLDAEQQTYPWSA